MSELIVLFMNVSPLLTLHYPVRGRLPGLLFFYLLVGVVRLQDGM